MGGSPLRQALGALGQAAQRLTIHLCIHHAPIKACCCSWLGLSPPHTPQGAFIRFNGGDMAPHFTTFTAAPHPDVSPPRGVHTAAAFQQGCMQTPAGRGHGTV